MPCGNWHPDGVVPQRNQQPYDLSGLMDKGFGGQVISRLGRAPMIPARPLARRERRSRRGRVRRSWYDDEKFGLAKVTKHYYRPVGGGWQRASLGNRESELAVLPKDYQAAFEVAAFESNMRMLAIYDSKNPDAIQRILVVGRQVAGGFKEILDVAYDTTISMLEEISSKDADFKAIYQHY